MKLSELIQELVAAGLKNEATVLSVEDVPSIRLKILAWLRENPDHVVPLAVEMIGVKAQREIDEIKTEDAMAKYWRRHPRKAAR